MNWLQQIGGLLGQYAGGQGQDPDHDFRQAAQHMPPQELAHGISHAFRSDQTPPFPDMVGQMFQHSDPNQRAGLLNTIMGFVGPALMQRVLGGALGAGGFTPQQAAQVHPNQIQQLLGMAQQQNPGIMDQMGGYVAQQPGLFQSLGSGALATALSGLAQRHPGGAGVAPSSEDPYGDPADQQVLDASQDPYGDPADQYRGQQVLDASQDPYGDPADLPRRR